MIKKHIAIIGIKGLPSKGGVERVVEAIIRKAADSDFKITVYTKKSFYSTSFISIPGINLIKIKDFNGKHLSAFSYGIFSALHALFFGDYDIVHLHCAEYGYIVPLLRLRYKVISTSHGSEYKRDKWGEFAKIFFKLMEIPFIKFSFICTCVSKSLSNYYQGKYHRKIIYIPNGIYLNDVEKIISKNKFKHYNLNKDEFILFCSGRIIPSKGCDILLKAYKKLNIEIPLVIIGNLEQDPVYKNYLLSLSNSKVIFIDFIESKEDLFIIISNCKFFVFPSTYEAMSMMLLEVASLKKCIICSDIIQNCDAIGNNAIFFKSGDYDNLRNKIKFALENENVLDKFGMKAYEWVINKRNWNIITKEYIKIYKKYA